MPELLQFRNLEESLQRILGAIRSGQVYLWIFDPTGVGSASLIKDLERCVAAESIRKKHRFSNVVCLLPKIRRGQRDVAQAMNKLLDDLAKEVRRKGLASRQWNEAHKDWRKAFQRYDTLLKEAEDAVGVAFDLRRALALRSVVLMGGVIESLASVALMASGHPMAIGVAGPVMSEIIPAVGEDIINFLQTRFEQADRELLSNPLQHLMPKFKRTISQLDSERIRIVVILDEYEQTCLMLEPWLSMVLKDKSFLRQSKIMMLVLCQYSLLRGHAPPYADQIVEIPLEPVVCSERPPAEKEKNDRIALLRLDKRTLGLIQDSSLKQLARLCAVPRLLDEDVFEDVKEFMFRSQKWQDCEAMKKSIQWVEKLPFVREGWHYDPTVRAFLVRALYHRSRRDYKGLHKYLEQKCKEALDGDGLYGREECEIQAERWYYALVVRPKESLAKALAAFMKSLDEYYDPTLPTANLIVIDIVGVLEDLLKLNPDEDAFRLWSDFVSGFHKAVEGEESFYRDKLDEYYMELYEQLLEFHFHDDKEEVGERLHEVYKEYHGFTKKQAIDYLRHFGEYALELGEYERAYQWLRKGWLEGYEDKGICVSLCQSLIHWAAEDPHKAQKCVLEDKDLLRQMQSNLPMDLSAKLGRIMYRFSVPLSLSSDDLENVVQME